MIKTMKLLRMIFGYLSKIADNKPVGHWFWSRTTKWYGLTDNYLYAHKRPTQIRFYHRFIYRIAMRMNNHFERFADWLIHHVPYDVRFKLG